MRLLWLPEVLRSAGLSVREYDGWRTRGSEDWNTPRGVVCHATAGSRTSTAAGELRTIAITGSNSAPAPISQLFLERYPPYPWWVVASGRCNHVKVGDKGPHEGYGNSYLIGVEAQNDNRGEPWPPGMVDAYQRGVAAILRRLGQPAGRAVAHREHQSGKSDPYGIDMTKFRARVAALLTGEDEDMAFDTLDEARLNAATERAAGLLAMRPEVRWTDPRDGSTSTEQNKLAAALLRLEAGLTQLAGRDLVDEDAIVSGVLAGLGGRSAEDVAEALVAAGQDPTRLAAALTALAGS